MFPGSGASALHCSSLGPGIFKISRLLCACDLPLSTLKLRTQPFQTSSIALPVVLIIRA